MTPQDQAGQMPPGLMNALMSAHAGPAPGSATAGGPPHVIDVVPPGDHPDPSVAADQPQLSPEEHLQAAIDHAQAALHAEPDSADSAKLAKIVHELYAVQSGQQDSQLSAMGGNPKQARALQKATPVGP